MNTTSTAVHQNSTILQRLGKTYHAATAVFEKMTGVTASRWRLLFLIHREITCTQKFLIAEIRVDPGSITRQLKTLEAEGLIQRKSDPTDNRLTLVKLSPKGDLFVKHIYDARGVFFERMLHEIPAEDVEMLTRVLDRIVINLNDEHPRT